MNPHTCQAGVSAASDQLAGVLSDAEQGALTDHLAGCDSCSCLMDQLHTTIAALESRPDVQVPDSLRALVTHTGCSRGEALTAQLPPLYALDANAADDLVQETLTSALADPDTEATGSGLAATPDPARHRTSAPVRVPRGADRRERSRRRRARALLPRLLHRRPRCRRVSGSVRGLGRSAPPLGSSPERPTPHCFVRRVSLINSPINCGSTPAAGGSPSRRCRHRPGRTPDGSPLPAGLTESQSSSAPGDGAAPPPRLPATPWGGHPSPPRNFRQGWSPWRRFCRRFG
jgi:hypothetical protein